MIGKTKKFLKEERKVYDTEVSLSVLLNHISVNFTYALIAGILLSVIPTYNYFMIAVAYFCYKKFEGIVIKRGGYSSKLGNQYVWPIPSVLGFISGVYLSELITTIM